MRWNKRIRDLREDHDMTQDELADKLNISKRTLLRYESGISEPTIGILISLSLIFNVSIDYIAGIKDTTIIEEESIKELFAKKEKQAGKSLLFVKNKKQDHRPCFDVVPLAGVASLEPPDKRWVSTVSPDGKIASNFSPNSTPTIQTHNKKKTGCPVFFCWCRWPVIPLLGEMSTLVDKRVAVSR